jgi:hypothetical protein
MRDQNRLDAMRTEQFGIVTLLRANKHGMAELGLRARQINRGMDMSICAPRMIEQM